MPKSCKSCQKDSFPLHHAVNEGHLHCLQIMIQDLKDPNVLNSNGCTPLHIASALGDLEMLTLLAQNGGNLEQRDSLGLILILSFFLNKK